ncbi:18104_t:CDS:2 [Acaulospora morrowiae]|uniref:18104_t:CDS:1 n=1 Tax=Acaulospora morrowiae TaxID=94023 RepID=A0A9N9BE19_9GLOM|nr:18104_t:CDS:2 [Acaulospora morrowiae]
MTQESKDKELWSDEVERVTAETFTKGQQTQQEIRNIPITTVCKFAHKLWRYMDVYNKRLEGRVAKWTIVVVSEQGKESVSAAEMPLYQLKKSSFGVKAILD